MEKYKTKKQRVRLAKSKEELHKVYDKRKSSITQPHTLKKNKGTKKNKKDKAINESRES